MRICPRYTLPALLTVAVALLIPHVGQAQGVSLSLLGGPGYTSWSGPYVTGGKLSPALGAVAIEWARPQRLAFRGEAGVGVQSADFGRIGLFSESTTLSVARVHLGGLVRLYVSSPTATTRVAIEIGGAIWRRTGCDVDMVGGPGFLGGSTVDCADWEPDAFSSETPLDPNQTGGNLLLGLSATRGKLGLTLRVEPVGSPLVTSPRGELRARTVSLAVEWVFKRGTPNVSRSAARRVSGPRPAQRPEG